MTRVSRALPLVLLGLVTVSACRKKPAATPEPVATMPMVDSAAIRDSIARARAQADADARRRAEEAARMERERLLGEARSAIAAPVYFEFDQADLSDDARMTLNAKIPVLQANQNLQLRISGHTDSRGSDEYNLALGQRRAAAVKQYLAQQGIADSRMEIVSMGEEQPAVQGENEGAWAQNRRAEFQIMAGDVSNPGGGRMSHPLARLTPVLALVASTACFATRSDVMVLQHDLSVTRAEMLAADSARRQQLDRLLASMTTVQDTVRSMNVRFTRFQGDVRTDLKEYGEQLIQVQSLLGVSQQQLQRLRAELESRSQTPAPVAVPPGGTVPPTASATLARGRWLPPVAGAGAGQCGNAGAQPALRPRAQPDPAWQPERRTHDAAGPAPALSAARPGAGRPVLRGPGIQRRAERGRGGFIVADGGAAVSAVRAGGGGAVPARALPGEQRTPA